MSGKILIVDDMKINQDILTNILKDEYEIMEASNGMDAWKIIIKERKSLSAVVLDLVMPEMDGFATMELIRQKYNMPIVLMTGDRNIETIERATKLGVDDYLTKPFLPLALKEIIHSTLN